jgi:general nucleoside transport system ATP-binding protein
MSQPNYVVEMLGVTKRFPGIVANDSITLQVKKGSIHALLGENGAGKSTLMNILFGLYHPDEGFIRVNGSEVSIDNPNVANDLGIGMVHQHFMLVHNFTVTQNIILGAEPMQGVRMNIRLATMRVKELSQKYGLQVDPDARIDEISVGQQQRVEILKTLYRGADILIFDEPTAVLTPQEIKELLDIMRSLVASGKTIILITHKLKEIMEVCDTVTIIRRGKVIDTLPVAGSNPDELAAKMVGREVHFDVEKSGKAAGEEPLLSIRGVTIADERGVRALDGMTFDVLPGEIFGIAGVDGNGQKELVEVLSGLRRPEAGEVSLKGEPIAGKTPRRIAEAGIAYIPEDRHKRGLVLDFDVGENVVLKDYYHRKYNRSGLLQYHLIYEKARQLISLFDIRTPDERTKARALSGGNQQKIIIAREIDRDPDVLIAAQPTRGLDVGAIEFIHRRLVEQRDKGKAVLLVSFELDEIMTLSDRIGVIYEGKLVGIVDPKQTTEAELGLMMAGANKKEAVR